MATSGPPPPQRARYAHGGAIFALVVVIAAVGMGVAYTDRHAARPNPVVARPPSPSGTVEATGPVLCVGPPLTKQSEVRPDMSYCGGHATTRIVLASADTWTGGEVSGVVTGRQQGAVQCGDPCTLVDMYIHDNPRAFAGIYAPQSGDLSGPMTISGGRVTGSGSLGIGGGNIGRLSISGTEIDHNGASADCSFEGGGFKGINHGSEFTDNYVHDNNCVGVWYDINAANNAIDHNRVDNNADGGILYEISQDASIYDNTVSGNGADACSWLFGGGITVTGSFHIQVYGNMLTNNCNGITGIQQNRPDSTPPAHLLAHLRIHDNVVSGPGRTGVASDNGADLTTRDIVFHNNTMLNGQAYCGTSC